MIWLNFRPTTNKYISDNVKYIETKDTNWMIYLIFKNGSFSIDSYFFINGILLCQMFFDSSREMKIKNLNTVSKHFQQFFLLISFKVLRILLPYLTVIHSLRIAMKHFNENSILNVPSNDHLSCENIWKNLLFLDNFGPYSERVSEIEVSWLRQTFDFDESSITVYAMDLVHFRRASVLRNFTARFNAVEDQSEIRFHHFPGIFRFNLFHNDRNWCNCK